MCQFIWKRTQVRNTRLSLFIICFIFDIVMQCVYDVCSACEQSIHFVRASPCSCYMVSQWMRSNSSAAAQKNARDPKERFTGRCIWLIRLGRAFFGVADSHKQIASAHLRTMQITLFDQRLLMDDEGFPRCFVRSTVSYFLEEHLFHQSPVLIQSMQCNWDWCETLLSAPKWLRSIGYSRRFDCLCGFVIILFSDSAIRWQLNQWIRSTRLMAWVNRIADPTA